MVRKPKIKKSSRLKAKRRTKITTSSPPRMLEKEKEFVDPGTSETEKLCLEISEALKKGDFNPMMRQMAMVAMGDVVGLGYMTRQEFLQEADDDAETGKCLQPSGQMMAMKLIPPRLRAKMMGDL